MQRYTDYDPFAWLYATHWGGEYHEQAFAVLDRLVLKQLPHGAAILDLCCGDGRLVQVLDMKGFRMTGLEGSERMLEFARERCPGIPFIAADARTFKLPCQFDAVISTFDALNHVMTTEGFADVCRRVFAVLKPGGYFAFDLNREEAYTDVWAQTSAQVEPDMVSVSVGSYSPERRVAHCDVTLFRQYVNVWARSDFRLSQYCHRQEDVEKNLRAAGFPAPSVYDASNDLGMFGNIGKGRDYYLARRPS